MFAIVSPVNVCNSQSSEMDDILSKLTDAYEKLSKYNTRNINEKLKRRDEKIANLESKLKESSRENEELWKTVAESEEKREDEVWGVFVEREAERMEERKKVDELKEQKIALQKRVHKMKKKMEGLQKEPEQVGTEGRELEAEIMSLRERIRELEDINTFLESDTINTFENGKYTNEIRECCMELLTEGNVSMSKVPNVIKTVLKRLTGKLPNRLPSKSLLSSRIMAEAKIVACAQVSNAMLQGFNPTDMKGNVLHQDATTKFDTHYEGMQVTMKDGNNMSIGLSKVGGGDGATYTDVFKDIIEDLANAYMCNSGDEFETVRAKLVTSIKSLMSDQCATNGVFNNNIQTIRSELLPVIIENFNALSEQDKQDIKDMGKFACRLHLIANFGEAANKALKMFEESITEGKNPHSFDQEESGTFRLARTAAKALTKRGSDKAGIASFWDVYLKAKGQKNHLATFHGHRINIAFHDCAAVVFHTEHIRDMLQDWHDPNRLLQSLLFDINEKVFIAGSRAMGIFDKLVTAPLWNILESNGSILELNEDLLQMKQVLLNWSNDGSEPLGGALMFPEAKAKVRRDELLEALFQATNDPQLDSFTQIALELLSTQLLIILERQASTQLPGGEYFEPSNKVKEMASNVPKTNAVSERDMAILDNLLRAKPSASTLSLESVLMWSRNKPSEWINNLSVDERNKLLNYAQKEAPSYMEKIKIRQNKVQDVIAKKLQEKKDKKAKIEQNKVTAKINVRREISKYGGLWAVEEIEQKLLEISEYFENDKSKEKAIHDALLSQIKFHKSVLNSSGPKELFQESFKKVKYTNAQLKQNKRKILDLNEAENEKGGSPQKSLKYKSNDDIKEMFQSKKQLLFEKLSAERFQRQMKQQKEKLPGLLANPESLVGKRVSHKCEENGMIQWFKARVVRLRVLKQDAIKTEYDVVYDESPDDEWYFPLLIDLKKGDLIIED